jgi:hypothetical protein
LAVALQEFMQELLLANERTWKNPAVKTPVNK